MPLNFSVASIMAGDGDKGWTINLNPKEFELLSADEHLHDPEHTESESTDTVPHLGKIVEPLALDASPPITPADNVELTPSAFERLPAEIRQQIYKLLLQFDHSLHHRERLLPFLFVGQDRKSRLKLVTDAANLLPGVSQICSHESVWDHDDSGMAVLCLNKQMFGEAIAVFYELNAVEIPAGLLCIKRLRKLLPNVSDLTLARNIDITTSSNCWVDSKTDPYNTLNAVYHRFPHICNITIEVEHQKAYFMGIFLSFQKMETASNVHFTSLGRFETTFANGVSCTIVHGAIVRAWAALESADTMAQTSRSHACKRTTPQESRVGALLEAKQFLDKGRPEEHTVAGKL